MPFGRTPRRTNLGAALHEIRRRKNLSQAEFGDLLEWPRVSVAQYEAGRMRPSIKRLIMLLRLAATEDERRPVLMALEAYGILASDLAVYVHNSSKGPSAALSEGAIAGELGHLDELISTEGKLREVRSAQA